MTDSPEPAGHRLERHDPFPLGPEVLRPPPRTGIFGRFAIVNGRLPDIFLTPHFAHRASDVRTDLWKAGWMAMSCSFICEAPSRALQEFPIDVLLRQTALPRKQFGSLRSQIAEPFHVLRLAFQGITSGLGFLTAHFQRAAIGPGIRFDHGKLKPSSFGAC